MTKTAIFILLITSIGLITFIFKAFDSKKGASGAPPYQIEDLEPPSVDEYSWLLDWKRPEGPAKVGLQVGHWNSSELPDELKRLRGNTGSKGGGKWEWEVNMEIAQLTAEILKNKGVDVQILPATVPTDFWADVFVAIHADGSEDTTKTGFKAAKPRRDFSGKADKLLALVEEEYYQATKMEKDPNVTRNMTGYYAFSWWRYDHAVHPKTSSIILETGFLTSQQDRKIIIGKSEKSAEGLANGIIKFLESEDLLH